MSDAPFYQSDAHGLVFNVSASRAGNPRDQAVNFIYRVERDQAALQEVSELRRLLYVGATRAETHLIFSGLPRGRDQSLMAMLASPFAAAAEELRDTPEVSIAILELEPVPITARAERQHHVQTRDIAELAREYSTAAGIPLVYPRRAFTATDLNAISREIGLLTGESNTAADRSEEVTIPAEIDWLHDWTGSGTRKAIMKQIDGLTVYNNYIQRQVGSQEQELVQLQQSMDQVGIVERQIMPLMIRMLDGLEQFVNLDKPFLLDERLSRVNRLRSLMERADVTLAEKFRSLTEAFQIENDFGRTIEVYKDALVLDEANLEVNVLRLGRVGLYYQTNDASATGRWDDAAKQWTPLTDRKARNQVRQGIRIARKLVAPDLLLLEVPAPEVAK